MNRLAPVALTFALTFALAACASPPEKSRDAAAICSQYAERLRGVWFDEAGRPVQNFILASNANGYGCYAWLNAVPEWGFAGPGSGAANPVLREGDLRIWAGPDHRLRVDLATGRARFDTKRGSFVGRLIRDAEPTPRLTPL